MQTLFTVETPQVRLIWSAPRPTRSGASPFALTALGAETVQRVGETRSDAVWLEEETTSLVLVQSLSGEAVTLSHRDPVVTAALVSADGARVLHGPIRTGSQAGRMSFEVHVGSRPSFAFELDVLPSKLEAAEVAAMRAEVEAFAAGLSLATLRPATAALAHGADDPSPPVWVAALRQSTGMLERAVREIERRPLLESVHVLQDERSGAIRRPSAETRKAALQRGLTAPRLPARSARLTADTPAHRWLSARIDEVAGRLDAMLQEEGGRWPTPRRRVVMQELEAVRERFRQLSRSRVLERASGDAPAVPPLVLRRSSAYALAFDALRALDRGVDLRAGALDVATQDLAVLFETWSALAVVRCVARVLGAPLPDRPFGIDTLGTDVRLRRGRAHGVRLAGHGTEVDIVYTPRFAAPPALLVQRPDLLLTVRGGSALRRVVLDAKYRRDDSAGYQRRHGAAGPPEDALGTLHRYRDAIVDGPRIDRAVALFPGTFDPAFAASRLWTSLDRLGVGAIPIRPGAEDALEAFIAGLVR